MRGLSSKSDLWQSPWLWAGLLLLLLCLVRLLSGYDGLYGQDAYAYYNYALDIQAHWRTGEPMGNLIWPRIYPFIGALWLWGDPGPWMQVVSMMATALFLAMTIKLLQNALPTARSLGALAFLCIGLAPFLLRSGLSVMSDALALGLMTWALWLGTRYLQTHRLHHLLFAGLLTGAAVWTRYPVALPMAIPCMVWLWHAGRQRAYLGLLLFVPVLLLAAIPQYIILPHDAHDGFGHAFQNTHLIEWSPRNIFLRDFQKIDGAQHYSTPNILASFGIFWNPRCLGLGLLGVLPLLLRKRLRLPAMAWPELAALSVYALFLAGISFQNPRFLLLMLPFAALILAPGWVWLLGRMRGNDAVLAMGRRSWLAAAFVLAFGVQLGLGVYASRLNIAISRVDQQIAADLKQLPQQGRHLYEFSLESMLQARQVGFEMVNMWYAGMPQAQAGDLVLFNLELHRQQFAGLQPMQNWDLLAAAFQFVEINQWEGGWRLYELH
jgi:4-amino-4-deoxy-L-arabinose transferase-like glycosyltransferase